MKSKAIISEIELSYEELKCMESHFRHLKRKAVVDGLKKNIWGGGLSFEQIDTCDDIDGAAEVGKG